MLIGRPLLRRCCSPSSKLPDTRLSSTTTTATNTTHSLVIIAIAAARCELRHRYIGIHCGGGRLYSHWGLIRSFSTDGGAGAGRGGGYQDGPGGRHIGPKPHTTGYTPSIKYNGAASSSLPTEQSPKVDIPPELAKDSSINTVVFEDPLDDFDDFLDNTGGPGPDSRLINNRDRQADEEFFAVLDRQRRERASKNKDSVRGVGPSNKTLEDTSRFLLSELLTKDPAGKPGYKKGILDGDTESDLTLLQKALDVSITRIQKNAKPGYHPLPFYLHQNSKPLDEALKNVLQERQPDIVNKVCYNLLISDAAPTIKTFNILLRRFTRLRMTALARVILSTLFAIGFEPNAHTYAAILHYLTVTQNYEAFNRAVQIMRDTFLDFKNPVLGAAELNGWSKLGNFMGMRRRLRLLQEEGLRDDIYILAIELRYFAKRHMWEGGLPALMLLLKKDAKDIDHRALYWAFKLCVNCQQHEFADRLKAVVQEKRWPIQALWTKGVRTRGLTYGYKGQESGQLVPKGTDPPQWTELWNPGVKSREPWELKKANIRTMARVPEVWREYSSAFWEKANGEDGGVDMRKWKGGENLSTSGVGVGKGADVEKQGVTIENEQFKLTKRRSPIQNIKVGDHNKNEALGTKPGDVPENMPKREFRPLEGGNIWKSLLKRRKRELLRPETRGPKPPR
ncbi:hypothetical protein TWF481_012082 [Arthrobotrys musiformis]|uniref:Uncharacterized protein n=1 Tax=Arthrobotrys musiformis TaxID=47236 RepID=A0AAV9VXK0_9PEZI